MGCCDDWTRSHFLRAGAAQAGKGLPEVEVGMPTPAGTGLNRRQFVLRSAGLALAVYGAGKLLTPQAFEEGIANASTNGRVLVSVFMDGGMDGLSLLAPATSSQYIAKRPTLKIDPATSAGASRWDSSLYYNANAAGLKALDDASKVAVFPAIGYDHPDQSHFTSRHFWEVGALDTGGQTGWMGRVIDALGTDDNPLQGLSLSNTLSPSLATADKPVAAVTGVTGYTLDGQGVWNSTMTGQMQDAFGQLGSPPASATAMKQARRAAGASAQLRSQLASVPSNATVYRNANDSFVRRMRGLAAMISSTNPVLPLQCVAISASGGYDTHSDQATGFNSGILRTTQCLQDFQADLEAKGVADRVLTLVWSEFGRRPDENGSQGTDHGAGGAAFLIGTKAKGQLVGSFPGLGSSGLDSDGNLKNSSDFRSVYAQLVDKWLGGDPQQIVPEGYALSNQPDLVLP